MFQFCVIASQTFAVHALNPVSMVIAKSFRPIDKLPFIAQFCHKLSTNSLSRIYSVLLVLNCICMFFKCWNQSLAYSLFIMQKYKRYLETIS